MRREAKPEKERTLGCHFPVFGTRPKSFETGFALLRITLSCMLSVRACVVQWIQYSVWLINDIVGETRGYWIPAFAGMTRIRSGVGS